MVFLVSLCALLITSRLLLFWSYGLVTEQAESKQIEFYCLSRQGSLIFFFKSKMLRYCYHLFGHQFNSLSATAQFSLYTLQLVVVSDLHPALEEENCRFSLDRESKQ